MPGKTCDINIPYTTAVDDKAEYVITFSLVLKKSTSWSKQGYEMAQQQFKLSAENVAGTSIADPTFVQKDHGKLPAIEEKGKLKVKDNTITGNDFSITFAEDGTLANWTYRNTQLVQPNAGPDFNGFRRIANDNVNLGATGGVAENENKEEGALTGKKMMVKAPKKQGKNVVVETAVTNGKDTHQIAYIIYPNGTVDMKVTTNNSSEETRKLVLPCSLLLVSRTWSIMPRVLGATTSTAREVRC